MNSLAAKWSYTDSSGVSSYFCFAHSFHCVVQQVFSYSVYGFLLGISKWVNIYLINNKCIHPYCNILPWELALIGYHIRWLVFCSKNTWKIF